MFLDVDEGQIRGHGSLPDFEDLDEPPADWLIFVEGGRVAHGDLGFDAGQRIVKLYVLSEPGD